MAKPPPGAMSSPYGENAEEGGSLKDLLKATEYFKDAQFNTDTPKSPFDKAKEEQKAKDAVSAKGSQPASGKGFDMSAKKDIINMLMDRNIDPVNITESDITFKYKEKLYRITTV